jgi:hypothetical protein
MTYECAQQLRTNKFAVFDFIQIYELYFIFNMKQSLVPLIPNFLNGLDNL